MEWRKRNIIIIILIIIALIIMVRKGEREGVAGRGEEGGGSPWPRFPKFRQVHQVQGGWVDGVGSLFEGVWNLELMSS